MNKKASTFIAVISAILILGGCASTPEKHLKKSSKESEMCVVPDNCAGGPTRIVQHAIDTIVNANFPERAGVYKAVMWKDRGELVATTGLGVSIHVSTSLYMALTWDQLVAVMAHELAHQQANHVLIGMGVSSTIWIVDKATWFITPWMILSPVDGLINSAFERNLEIAADLMAIEYLENAGYTKDDYLALLAWIKKSVTGGGGCRVLCDHPHINDRIKAVTEGRNVLHVETSRREADFDI